MSKSYPVYINEYKPAARPTEYVLITDNEPLVGDVTYVEGERMAIKERQHVLGTGLVLVVAKDTRGRVIKA